MNDYFMKEIEEIHEYLFNKDGMRLGQRIKTNFNQLERQLNNIEKKINRLRSDNHRMENQYEIQYKFLTNVKKDTEKKILTRLNWFYAWNLIVIASVIISLLVK